MNPATTTVKHVLSLASVMIVAGIVFTSLMGVFTEVNQKSTVNWINDELSPAVSHQCRRCLTCPGGEGPHPDNPIQHRFRSDEMRLEWKGENNNRLHLVTEQDGEVDLSVRIAVSSESHLVPGLGCKEEKVSLTGNVEDSGIKSFQVLHEGRGAEIRVQ